MKCLYAHCPGHPDSVTDAFACGRVNRDWAPGLLGMKQAPAGEGPRRAHAAPPELTPPGPGPQGNRIAPWALLLLMAGLVVLILALCRTDRPGWLPSFQLQSPCRGRCNGPGGMTVMLKEWLPYFAIAGLLAWILVRSVQARNDRARAIFCASCLGRLNRRGSDSPDLFSIQGQPYCGIECYLARPAIIRKIEAGSVIRAPFVGPPS